MSAATKDKLLPLFMYRNIKRFGNTCISPKRIKRLGGIEKILKDIKEQTGIECTYRVSYDSMNEKTSDGPTHIIEEKREYNGFKQC